jgi:benzoate-CoA ligase family protein
MSEQFNAAQYLVHRHVDEGRGDRVAVKGSRLELTYADVAGKVAHVSAAYRDLGLHRDDRVLLVASDDVPLLTSIVAAFHAGLVAVPVSTMLNGVELGKIIADSGARLVVCTEEFAANVAEALGAAPAVEFVIHVGDPGPLAGSHSFLVHSWDSFVARGSAAFQADPASGALEPTEDDSWALWLYTSGTTGLPKAAMHRHANIRHVCETYGQQVLGIVGDDATFSVAKLFFAYGIGNSLFFPFSVGATTVLEPRRPTPQAVLERLQRDRPTLFFAVPTFYAALAASDIPDDAFGSVRQCISAGEPLPAPLQKRFTERFGVEILDGIGSTEALHIFLSNRPGDIRPGTTGRPVPGYDIEIRDDLGAVAGVDQPGALFVHGDSIALGYWRRPDVTSQVFQGSWLSTGDTYVRDADGYYRCLGRNSDMLKAGGMWVSPAEVESRLLEHPAVREAAVVGLADADGIDKPAAVVVADGVSADELIAWCRDGLAHFKAPRVVVFVDELPKTATGKLQRFKVRAFLAETTSMDAAETTSRAAAMAPESTESTQNAEVADPVGPGGGTG